MKRLNAPSIGLTFLLVLTIMATANFDPLPFQEAQSLKRVKTFEPIDVLILENPMTQLRGQANTLWGLDADRLYEFSHHTGLKFKTHLFKDKEKLLEAYNSGLGHLVIARQSLSLEGASLGPLFEEIRRGLFCHKQIPIERLDNLASLRILKGTWPLKKEIHAVNSKAADCFYSELKEGQFAIQPYSRIKKMGEVPTRDHHAWWVRSGKEDLLVLLNSWYRKNSRSGELRSVEHRYDVTFKTLNEMDIQRFYTRVLQVLPDYAPAFKEVAKEVKLPWTLAAAVAYQESQWNNTAISFTGVKGLMQLTLQTAEHMGVSDREDPFQSIWGGTRYLKHLWEEWAEIKDPKDRMLFTLASYNIGIAHMYDVLDLVKQKGLNPYRWKNVEAILPLLEEEETYKDLMYGYARGTETVDFVNRTYSFYQLLSVSR